MITQGAAAAVLDAPLAQRAASILALFFHRPGESVSRRGAAYEPVDAANPNPSMITASIVPAGSVRGARDAAVRLVSEAWQVLEQARVICPDVSETRHGWFVLTAEGERARQLDDVEAELKRRTGVD